MFPNFANFQKNNGSAYCRSTTTKQISTDRFLGQEIQDAKERVQFLRDNADAIEELGYTKPIPTAQLDVLKDQLVQNNIQLRDIRADKKEAMKEFSNQIKELVSLREGSDDMEYHKENKKITNALKRVLKKYNNNAR